LTNNNYEIDSQPNPPDMSVSGSIYHLKWQDRGIQMRVERFYTDRHHNVEAEITVEVLGSPEGEGLITRGRQKLLSTFRTLIEDAVDFGGELNDKDDWKIMFKQMSSRVLDRYRMGEPIINLAKMERQTPKPYLLSPFIYEGAISLVYGKGGVGKSLFCLYLAVLLQMGKDDGRLTAKKANVVYLDYEADPDESKYRADSIIHGLEENPDDVNIHYRYCSVPLKSDLDAVLRYCLQVEADMVLIDSAIPACGGDVTDAGNVGDFFNAVRSLGSSENKIATLIIGHTTKAQNNSDGPFGSVNWRNQPRTVWEFKSNQVVNQDEIDVSLVHRKINLGKLLAPLAFRITFGQQQVNFEELDARRHSTFRADMPIGDQIEVLLEDHGTLESEQIGQRIQESTGANHSDVIPEVLIRDARFVEVSENRWELNAI